MGNYEQLEMDLRLDYERSLKDNVQTVVRFNHGKYMEETYPSKVNNHHEGYGILSENETVLTRAVKAYGVIWTHSLKYCQMVKQMPSVHVDPYITHA